MSILLIKNVWKQTCWLWEHGIELTPWHCYLQHASFVKCLFFSLLKCVYDFYLERWACSVDPPFRSLFLFRTYKIQIVSFYFMKLIVSFFCFRKLNRLPINRWIWNKPIQSRALLSIFVVRIAFEIFDFILTVLVFHSIYSKFRVWSWTCV